MGARSPWIVAVPWKDQTHGQKTDALKVMMHRLCLVTHSINGNERLFHSMPAAVKRRMVTTSAAAAASCTVQHFKLWVILSEQRHGDTPNGLALITKQQQPTSARHLLGNYTI